MERGDEKFAIEEDERKREQNMQMREFSNVV
jgi:hypothetical protein